MESDMRNYFQEKFTGEILDRKPIKKYCRHCLWTTQRETLYVNCPYGHGPYTPISEYYNEVTGGI